MAFGFDVYFSRPTPDTLRNRVLRRVLGMNLGHVLNNADLINEADIVWTVMEQGYLGVLFAAKIGMLKRLPKMIGQTIWLFDNWARYSSPRRAFYKNLLSSLSVMTVHSEKYITVVRQNCPEVDVRLMRFGISSDRFPIKPFVGRPANSKIKIFAPGRDKARDFETLLEAFGNDERFEVIISNARVFAKSTGYMNLRLPHSDHVSDLIECYRWADFVIIPLMENFYSGITVALEATALGVPIISSDTGGVPTYFTHDEVLYIPPRDSVALRNAALGTSMETRKAMVARAQERFLKEDYTTVGLAKRYADLSRDLLASP